jgi:guanylate kinase
MPPSVEELRSRLTKRGTDSEEEIAMRVQKAASEILLACSFDRVIVNDDLEKSCNEITAVVKEFIGLR